MIESTQKTRRRIMSITIRPAQKNDAHYLAPLIYSAIEDLAEHFTGASSANEAIERLAHLVAEEENRFSYQYALVIEDDGNIIGVGSAYPENIIDNLTIRTIELSKQFSWHIKSKLESRLLKDKEAPQGTYYIDHLAVNEDYRGRGYATLLIKAMESNALEMGFGVISLLVDTTNPKARVLYEKLGYSFLYNVLANGHSYVALVKNL
jgi:ribosomal protein S18 acetylase RimI-like enzyme